MLRTAIATAAAAAASTALVPTAPSAPGRVVPGAGAVRTHSSKSSTSWKKCATSAAMSSGCSSAKKCPPRGGAAQWRTLNVISIQLRGARMISHGAFSTPVGTGQYFPDASGWSPANAAVLAGCLPSSS